MNTARRKRLDEAIKLLTRAKELYDELLPLCEDAKAIVEEVASEERDAYDSMPEGLQNSERGQRADEVASNLESIEIELEFDFDDVISTLEDARG